MAEMMAKTLNTVQVVELPKEKRERKVDQKATVIDGVIEAHKKEPKKSDAENVMKDVDNMGKIELTAYIKNLTDLDILNELAEHKLKSVRDLAEKRIKEIA